jgi:hypothetical protein
LNTGSRATNPSSASSRPSFQAATKRETVLRVSAAVQSLPIPVSALRGAAASAAPAKAATTAGPDWPANLREHTQKMAVLVDDPWKL